MPADIQQGWNGIKRLENNQIEGHKNTQKHANKQINNLIGGVNILDTCIELMTSENSED